MDLLRLILARQPLDRLIDLPVLLGKPEFLRARRFIVNVRGKREDYILQCTMEGELCRLSFMYAKCRDLRNRAVFLRSVEWYNFFSETLDRDLDIWYAIGCGIPEIQARALALIRHSRNPASWLGEFGDPYIIEWTPKLKREVEKIILENGSLSEEIIYFFGYVGLRLPSMSEHTEAIFEDGKKDARNMKILLSDCTGEECIKRLEVGQVSSLLTFSSVATLSLVKAAKVLEIYDVSPAKFMEVAKTLPWTNIMDVTRSVVLRAREYLEDKRFVEIFSGTIIMDAYMVLSGYPPRKGNLAPLATLCGFLNGGLDDNNAGGRDSESVQGRVLYESQSYSAGMVAGRTAFLKGHVNDFRPNMRQFLATRGSYSDQVTKTSLTEGITMKDNWYSLGSRKLARVLAKHYNVELDFSIESPSWVDEMEEEILENLTSTP